MALPDDFATGDSITFSDSVSRVWGILRSCADSLTISESLTRIGGIALSLNDSIQVVDQLISAQQNKISFGDVLTIVDFLQTGRNNHIADNVSMSDQVTVAVYGHVTRTVADSVVLADSIDSTRFDTDYIRRYLNDVVRSF